MDAQKNITSDAVTTGRLLLPVADNHFLHGKFIVLHVI